MKRRVTSYQLYRWRYTISLSLGLIAILGLMVFAAFFVPGGLSASEQATAVTSSKITFTEFDPASVVNLPYHVMQRVTMELLNVSTISVKLPSILLGLLAIVGVFYLIRDWFRTNTAVITTLIIATTPLFLFLIQSGTPTIYGVTVSIWLLTTGIFVSRRKRPALVWKILFFLLLALNMYAPLGIYLNLALMSTVLFHPHIRHIARRISLERIIAGSVIGLIILTPLIYSISMQPQLALQLAGIPTSIESIGSSALTTLAILFGFNQDIDGPLLTPILSIGSSIVILIGAWRFILIKYTARSYILWLWSLILLPLVAINPQHAGLLLPLLAILTAMGIGTLIAEWYKLFPYNPYARLAGLLPIILVVGGLMFSGTLRYTTGYLYTSTTALHFTNDRQLLDDAIDTSGATAENPAVLLVSQDDKQFYDLVARENEEIRLAISATNDDIVINHRDSNMKMDERVPSRILTNSRSSQADRFYIYPPVEKSE